VGVFFLPMISTDAEVASDIVNANGKEINAGVW
jgi:hypothetical protein